MNYIVEVEDSSYTRMDLAEDVLRNLPFVKKITPIESTRKTASLEDVVGKLNWNVDGLEYQYQQRGY
jgi:hypothetical protein